MAINRSNISKPQSPPRACRWLQSGRRVGRLSPPSPFPQPAPRVFPLHPWGSFHRRHDMIRKFAPTLAGLSSFMITAVVLLLSSHT